MLVLLFVLAGCAPDPPVYPTDFGHYRIAIDAGHGGENLGVQSVFNTLEKDHTLTVAKMLFRRLTQGGHFKPFMVRTTDEDLSPAQRAKIVADAHVDALVSIHFNGGLQQSQSGFSLIWSPTRRYRDNIRLAAHQANALIDYGFDPDGSMGPIPENATPVRPADHMRRRRYMATAKSRGIFEDRTQYIGLLRRCTMPAVIVEGGYFSNYVDCALFHLKGQKQRLACAIEAGLIRFFVENEQVHARSTAR